MFNSIVLVNGFYNNRQTNFKPDLIHMFDAVMWQLCFIVISSVSNNIIILKQVYSI